MILLPTLVLALAAGPTPSESFRSQADDASPTVFVVRSRIEYLADPSMPQTLEALYVGHERARWNRRLLGGSAFDRDCLFRDGDQVHHLPQGSMRSTAWEEPHRSAGLLAFELRHATLLWPDAFAWEAARTEDGVTTRRVGLGSSDGDERTALGSLVATLGADGRPTSITSFDVEGHALETLEVRRWQERRGRAWPHELSLTVGEQRVWDERVESVVDRGLSIVDSFFLPPDRREAANEGGPTIVPLDLLGLTLRRLPIPDDVLAGDAPWEAAVAWCEARLAEHAEELAGADPPLALDPNVSVELDDRGRPVALLERLRVPVLPAPTGWTTLHDRPGLSTIVEGYENLDRRTLAALRRAAGDRPGLGTPYARVFRTAGRVRLGVHLPLVP